MIHDVENYSPPVDALQAFMNAIGAAGLTDQQKFELGVEMDKMTGHREEARELIAVWLEDHQ